MIPGADMVSFTGDLVHSWLRIERVVRRILEQAWDEAQWREHETEARAIWATRRRVREEGWFK